MQNISDFFKRIGGVHAKEIALRSSIQATIKEFVDIDIPISHITLKSGIITLKNIAHSARSSIYINKQKIIERVNIVLNSNNKVVDIR